MALIPSTRSSGTSDTRARAHGDEVPHTAHDTPSPIPRGVLALITLSLMTLLLLVAAFLASRALTATSVATTAPLVSVGTSASVPGGSVTVLDIEHAEPTGPVASEDSHAIDVRVLVQPEEGVGARELTGAMLLRGEGINGALAPVRAAADVVPPDDDDAEFTLTYVVPDDSTNLGIALPGGAVLSAHHDDHPGDDHPGDE